MIAALVFFLSIAAASHFAAQNGSVTWGSTVRIADPPTYSVAGAYARHIHPGKFGADYPRALRLTDGSWLCTYTGYEKGNRGYLAGPRGGTRIFVDKSAGGGKSWKQIAMLSDPGRDLDNGEMIQLPDGSILLATRSVRWQESYRLPVYRSTDNGKTWKYLSDIDSNEGKSGQLGHPDKGVYEPHFYQLGPHTLAVMYSSEKHVVENPTYSQIISEKLSHDNGATWGKEIWVAAKTGGYRPGMPVWTRMKNGKYIVTFEVCGPDNCRIHSKTSHDGIRWPSGLGTVVPSEIGAPYVLALKDGRLILTSNNHQVSMSGDYGKSWHLIAPAFQGGPRIAYWSSLYQTGRDEIMLLTGLRRPEGGRRIVARFGKLSPMPVHVHTPDGKPLASASSGTVQHDRVLIEPSSLQSGRPLDLAIRT